MADFALALFLTLDHIVYVSAIGLVRRITPEMRTRVAWLSFLAWMVNVLLEIRCHFKAYHDAHSDFKDEQRARMLELALDANSRSSQKLSKEDLSRKIYGRALDDNLSAQMENLLDQRMASGQEDASSKLMVAHRKWHMVKRNLVRLVLFDTVTAIWLLGWGMGPRIGGICGALSSATQLYDIYGS